MIKGEDVLVIKKKITPTKNNLNLTPTSHFSFLRKEAYIISLLKMCLIQSGIFTKIWKLPEDVAS